MQRMEQQVARAVEAAKARPKNKSLVMEGSLGKIAFSNSKTPRPLLNIKRTDSEARMRQAPKPADRKTALRHIEHLYSTLMKLEDHERRMPDPPTEESSPDVIEGHMKWRSAMQELNQQLWEALKVMEPIHPKYDIFIRSNMTSLIHETAQLHRTHSSRYFPTAKAKKSSLASSATWTRTSASPCSP